MDQSILYCAFPSSPVSNWTNRGGGNISTHSGLPYQQLLRKKLFFFIAFVYGMRYLIFMRARMLFCFLALFLVLGKYLPEFNEHAQWFSC